MLDQSFKYDNLRKIYDIENRKGNSLDELFYKTSAEFAHLRQLSLLIKDSTGEIQNLIANKANILPTFSVQIEAAQLKLQAAREEKDLYIEKYLREISNFLELHTHTITLTPKVGPGGKILYVTDNDPKSFFIQKQIQYNFRKIYKIKPSDKSLVVQQLRSYLLGKFPIFGIKTDISDFYESIDHQIFLNKIRENQYLSSSSIKYINQIIFEYRRLSGKNSGLPRGVGISAYLSELYMIDVDAAISSHESVIYYSRYVDDIIVMLSRNHQNSYAEIEFKIDTLLNAVSLTRNILKTSEIDRSKAGKRKFSYLGYEFDISGAECSVDMSLNKRDRYSNRLNVSFTQYSRRKFHDASADDLLLKRIKFLTSNTHLINNKRKAHVGIYFSNQELNKFSGITYLDGVLKNLVSSHSAGRFMKRLAKYTFETGFVEQRYVKFSPQEISKIVSVWKHV